MTELLACPRCHQPTRAEHVSEGACLTNALMLLRETRHLLALRDADVRDLRALLLEARAAANRLREMLG